MNEPVVPGEHLSDEELEEHKKVLDEAEALAREIRPVRMTREEIQEKLSKRGDNESA